MSRRKERSIFAQSKGKAPLALILKGIFLQISVIFSITKKEAYEIVSDSLVEVAGIDPASAVEVEHVLRL